MSNGKLNQIKHFRNSIIRNLLNLFLNNCQNLQIVRVNNLETYQSIFGVTSEICENKDAKTMK